MNRVFGWLYGLTPRGRCDRRVLTDPDVQQGFRLVAAIVEAQRQAEEWQTHGRITRVASDETQASGK